jgi:hypothetical protein
MTPHLRYLLSQIERDLHKKMVFVAGPRQVGKTTLARSLEGANRGYLNWDIPEDREKILKRQLPPTLLWVFDEISRTRMAERYFRDVEGPALVAAHQPGERLVLAVPGANRAEAFGPGRPRQEGRLQQGHGENLEEDGESAVGAREEQGGHGGASQPAGGEKGEPESQETLHGRVSEDLFVFNEVSAFSPGFALSN